MGMKEVEKRLEKSNLLMERLIQVTERTAKILTVMNVVNVVTLLAVAIMICKEGS